MDAFRHLNNGATGRYFEEGRATLNIRIFGVDCMINPPDGLQLLFASTTTDYLLQAYYPGKVEICTGIAKIGNSSYAVAQAAFQNGKCFALSQAAMVKARHGRPELLSETERAAMRKLHFPE
jgi:acyl-CoA thioester hydrolase